MRRIAFCAVSCALLAGLLIQQRGSVGESPAPATDSGLVVKGTVHSIHLPEIEPELPKAAGRETTQLYCAVCHTSHYIMIQPPLSRETWLTEVTKMRKTFSAPIPEEKVPEIVNYLVAVRGQ
jgi:hypothetical protein